MSAQKRRSLYVIAGILASLVGLAHDGWAQQLELAIANDRVTLVADSVPIAQILAVWECVGQTTIINGEKLAGPPVTLRLVDVPEAEALRIVLRSASGYLAARRQAGTSGASVFDRILILASSRAPAATARVTPEAPPAETELDIPQVLVPFLIAKAEADSVKLGTPGQVIVVDSPPVARIRSSECQGWGGDDAAVQTVLVIDEEKTYITSLIVCGAGGLRTGQTLGAGRVGPDAPGSKYSQFVTTER